MFPYPTTLVVSSDLQVVKRITGYRTPNQLSKDLGGLCHHSAEADHGPAPQAPATSGRATSPFGEWCPVSPVVDGEFFPGQAAVSAVFRGYEVWFRDEQHRQRFLENPHQYWPVGDGYCVVSWFDEQVARPGSMRFGLEHRGAIWFFASEAHRNRFAADPARYLQLLAGTRQAVGQE